MAVSHSLLTHSLITKSVGLRIVLLGPPGSGKGTLAQQFSKRVGLAHLSAGELFRQEILRRSTLGKRVSRYVTSGRLVPDAIVVRVMTKRLSRRLLGQGVVLDGFPRTVGQAQGLDTFLAHTRHPLDGAIALRCPARALIVRLGGRRICSRCGAIYHVKNMPPKQAGRCDRCGGSLSVRKDDQVATIRKRLAIDRVQSQPLLAYYRQQRRLYRLDGSGSSEQVFRRSMVLFRRQGWF